MGNAGSGACIPLSAAEAVLGHTLATDVEVAVERESPGPRLNRAGQVDLIAELDPPSLAPLAPGHSDAAGGCGAAAAAVLAAGSTVDRLLTAEAIQSRAARMFTNGTGVIAASGDAPAAKEATNALLERCKHFRPEVSNMGHFGRFQRPVKVGWGAQPVKVSTYPFNVTNKGA